MNLFVNLKNTLVLVLGILNIFFHILTLINFLDFSAPKKH